jgi:AraC-like DNA-binding protein
MDASAFREGKVSAFCHGRRTNTMAQSNVQPHKLKFYVFADERFVDLNLYQFGWEQTEPLHAWGPYIRNHYLFHYVISGKGILLSQGQEYTITAGHGFLIEPSQITTYRSDPNDPWEYIWVEFDGLRAYESLRLAGLSMKSPIYTPVNREAGRKLQEIMQYIVNHHEEPPMHLIGYGFLFLNQLTEGSADRRTHTDKRLQDFYMKEAMTFIEQNYHRDISIEDVANTCGLSRAYFGKLFRNATGETPQSFLINYRMNCATQLLKDGHLSVQEVGRRVGYENQLHFSRAFKSVYGMSPSSYRRTHFMESMIEHEREQELLEHIHTQSEERGKLKAKGKEQKQTQNAE